MATDNALVEKVTAEEVKAAEDTVKKLRKENAPKESVSVSER